MVPSGAQLPSLTPAEVLDQIREARAATPPYAAKLSYQIDANYAGYPSERERILLEIELFKQERNVDRRLTNTFQKGNRDPREQFNQSMWQGDTYITVSTAESGPLAGQWSGGISKEPRHEIELSAIHSGGELLGIFTHDDEPFFTVLEQAENVTVKIDASTIEGVSTYLLNAKTPRGEYTVWVDPQQGFHIRKAVVSKKSEDLGYRDEKLSDYNWQPLNESTTTLDDVVIQMIDGQAVVTSGRLVEQREYSEGGPGGCDTSRTQTEISVDAIEFNPDFEQLGAFKMLAPAGTILTDWDINAQVVLKENGVVPYIEYDETIEALLDADLAAARAELAPSPSRSKYPEPEALGAVSDSAESDAPESYGSRRVMILMGFLSAFVALAGTFFYLRRSS